MGFCSKMTNVETAIVAKQKRAILHLNNTYIKFEILCNSFPMPFYTLFVLLLYAIHILYRFSYTDFIIM